jgi:CheY-like chemotaxis protein
MNHLRSAHGLRGIALSGYGMQEDLDRSRKAGFVAHLVKPVSISDLRQTLEEISRS